MDPKLWGPCFWRMLYFIARSFPENQDIDEKFHYFRFFLELGYILPCKACQKEYQKHFNLVSINNYLNSRESLFEWILIIHNMINKNNNKAMINAKEFHDKYIGSEGKTSVQTVEYFSQKPSIFQIITGFILVAIVITLSF